MLKIIYNLYKKRFLDLMIDDMLLDIPKNISEVGIEMLSNQRELVTKFLYWQAHSVHRRDPSDFLNMERKMGMLIQIKLLLTLIGNSPRKEEEHPVVGKTVAPPEDWTDAVKNFKERKVLKKK